MHNATHHQMDVGRGLAAIASGTPRGTGTIAQINVSGGGVPKGPVARATVTYDGLDGDTQADRKHHGRPFQALCLWSSDVIAELAAAGHPIEAGAAGENLTLTGIDWATLRPGARLRVGTALAEVSYPRRRARNRRGGSRTATSIASTTTATHSGSAGTRGYTSPAW